MRRITKSEVVLASIGAGFVIAFPAILIMPAVVLGIVPVLWVMGKVTK